jgi:hypothetical protein
MAEQHLTINTQQGWRCAVAFDVAKFEAAIDRVLFAAGDREAWGEVRTQVKELAREVGRLGVQQVDLGGERLRHAEKRLDELARIVHDQGNGMTARDLEVAQLRRQVGALGVPAQMTPPPRQYWEQLTIRRTAGGFTVRDESGSFSPAYEFVDWDAVADFARRALERGG